MRVGCQDTLQQSTYVCQSARGFAPIGIPPGCWSCGRARGNISFYFIFHFGFYKIRRELAVGREGPVVDTVTVCIRRRARAQPAINVKLRPGRIHRPPDVAEHQLRGRWHQPSSFILL